MSVCEEQGSTIHHDCVIVTLLPNQKLINAWVGKWESECVWCRVSLAEYESSSLTPARGRGQGFPLSPLPPLVSISPQLLAVCSFEISNTGSHWLRADNKARYWLIETILREGGCRLSAWRHEMSWAVSDLSWWRMQRAELSTLTVPAAGRWWSVESGVVMLVGE